MAEHDPVGISAAVGTVASAVVSIFAAAYALRSARVAERQTQQMERAERQRLERELAVIANRVLALSLAVKDLGDQVLAANRLLAISGGTFGGSRQTLHEDAVTRLQQSGLTMQGEALVLLERRNTWKDNTEDELSAHLSKLEGHAIQLDRVRRRLERDLDSTETICAQYRERTLNRSPSS